MSVASKCPNCKLINPAESRWCDCGFNFETHEVKAPPAGAGRAEDSLLASSRWLLLLSVFPIKVIMLAAGAPMFADLIHVGILLLAWQGFREKRERGR